MEAAKKAAAQADAVLFVAGYNFDDEGEYISGDDFGSMSGAAESVGGDRKPDFGLHKDESRVDSCSWPGKPEFCSCNDWWEYHYHEGMAGQYRCCFDGILSGTGRRNCSAEILFGDVNPSGKLPFVIPQDEADLPQVDWEATEQYYGYYHGYTKLEKEGIAPLYPYGHGLSYTTFKVS